MLLLADFGGKWYCNCLHMYLKRCIDRKSDVLTSTTSCQTDECTQRTIPHPEWVVRELFVRVLRDRGVRGRRWALQALVHGRGASTELNIRCTYVCLGVLQLVTGGVRDHCYNGSLQGLFNYRNRMCIPQHTLTTFYPQTWTPRPSALTLSTLHYHEVAACLPSWLAKYRAKGATAPLYMIGWISRVHSSTPLGLMVRGPQGIVVWGP